MTNLISGADALRALADGQEVQHFNKKMATLGNLVMDEEWGCCDELTISDFNSGLWAFRIKPRTITLNGIEVPCCGKDYQYGDAMYILNSLEPEEYSMIVLDKVDEVPLYWWRSEDEIKQVVEALRQVFGGV